MGNLLLTLFLHKSFNPEIYVRRKRSFYTKFYITNRIYIFWNAITSYNAIRKVLSASLKTKCQSTSFYLLWLSHNKRLCFEYFIRLKWIKHFWGRKEPYSYEFELLIVYLKKGLNSEICVLKRLSLFYNI